VFNVGAGELFVILAVALVVLGPNRLPEAVRTAGKVVGEVRRITGGFQQELRSALEADGTDGTDGADPHDDGLDEDELDEDDDAGELDEPDDLDEPEPDITLSAEGGADRVHEDV
jgi:sec-independent protein translocase protein TatB